MSTNRHMNKICVAAIGISLVLTLLIMSAASLGAAAAGRTMGYEDRLFDTSSVHTIDIVMDDWEEFIQNCESEEYSPCAVVIDGESYRNIGIRAKGNTSLSSVRAMGSQRYSFKLEFDQYEKGKTYYGLDKLCLNNLIQDNTMMKDYLVYVMMSDFGVDAPLCSYVYITVNGEDWGLYLAVEGVEEGFLQRNYGSDSGNLYKPDSMSFGGGRGNGREFDFNNLDFDNQDFDSQGFDNQDLESPDLEKLDSDNPDFDGSASWDVPQNASGSGGDFAGTEWNTFDARPQAPGSGNFQGGGFPTPPEESIPQGGEVQEAVDGTAEGAGSSQVRPGGGRPAGIGGGFGGMGSDDVKLKYIDDDTDSYSNIFDNAKTKITDVDRQRLIASLKKLNQYTDLEDTLDTEEVLRYFVVHNFVCNDDSYTGAMIHNYYLHEKDGQLSMIPWDYNLAFGTFQGGDGSSSVNASIDSPVSGGSVDDRPMLGWIFSDESYTSRYHELFSQFAQRWFSDGQLTQRIGETQVLLRPFVEKDPTKFCTLEEFDIGVGALEKFVDLRAEAVSRQLSGDASQVDTAGLDLSDMGTMDGMMGGGFGPGNGSGVGEDNPGADIEGEAGPEGAGDASAAVSAQGHVPQWERQPVPGEGFQGFPDSQPGGRPSWGEDAPEMAEGTGGDAAWLLLGASVIVLLAGLFAAKRNCLP